MPRFCTEKHQTHKEAPMKTWKLASTDHLCTIARLGSKTLTVNKAIPPDSQRCGRVWHPPPETFSSPTVSLEQIRRALEQPSVSFSFSPQCCSTWWDAQGYFLSSCGQEMIVNCPDAWPPRLLHHCHCLVDLRQHNTQGVASSLDIKSCSAARPAGKPAKTPLAPTLMSTARSGCPLPEQNSTFKIFWAASYQLSGFIPHRHFTVFTVWSPCIGLTA